MKRLLSAVALTGSLLSVSPVLAVTYSITDLGTSFIPDDINNSGVVVGITTANSQPIIWTNGAFTTIGSGSARAINSSGMIVGESGNSPKATSWQNGTTQYFNNLPNTQSSTAYSVNNLGQAAGSTDRQIGYYIYRHAAFWDNNGAAVDLGTLNNTPYSASSGINDSGQIVGYSTYSEYTRDFHPFIYVNGRMKDLAVVPGSGYAVSINNNGVAVGGYAGYYSPSLATIWGLDAGIGTLPGGHFSGATDINNVNQVIGYSETAGSLYQHGFLWQDGVIKDLNDYVSGSGWELWSADAINDGGSIIGRGILNGETHAYLLSPVVPVPEPATILLLGAGLGALTLMKKKKAAPI